jgi:P4 family phage/plasmid primase-like protien
MAESLRPEHLRELVELHAIAPEIAVHVATSVPEGMVFNWWDGNGTLVPQLRRDPDKRVDGRPKYEWPKDQPLVLNHWREPAAGHAVLLVEGTCQHLAVASWTVDVGVYGMVGCWGWAKTDLGWARGRDVVVAFDADLTGNRKVWEAAKALGDALVGEGAASLRFVKPPGRAKEGLDDVLARRKAADRTEYLTRLIALASDKLGRAPAAKVMPKVDVVAAEIMRAQPLALTAEDRLALYRDGAYRRDAAAFNAAFTRVVGEDYRHGFLADAEGFLRGTLHGDGVKLPDRAPTALLNVANGMLNLETGVRYPHDPRYLSAVQLPVAWNPDATCPVYEAWLTAQVGAQADDLEEVAATMLDPSHTPAKAAFLFGPSRSGKSTFIRLAEAMAGSDNTSAVTLSQLSENRFAAVNVYGKILNAAAEVRAGHIEDLEIFKKMAGNDPIEAERKFVQAFKFYNQALFIFAANELPTVGESSRAYSERIKPFKFSRSFAGAEDARFEAAMMTEREGILVRWVAAWRRWKQRGRYLPTDPAVAREFEARSDRVRQWVQQCCRVITVNPGGQPVVAGAYLPPEQMTLPSDLARQFVTWSAETGAQTMTQRKIIDRLVNIPGVVVVRRSGGGEATRGGRGLNVVVLPRTEWADDLSGYDAPIQDANFGAKNESASSASKKGLLTSQEADEANPHLLSREASSSEAQSEGGVYAQNLPHLPHSVLAPDNEGDQWTSKIVASASVTTPPAAAPSSVERSKAVPASATGVVPPSDAASPSGSDSPITATSAPGATRTTVVVRSGLTIPATVTEARPALVKIFRDTGSLTVDVETSGYPVGHRDHQLRTVQIGGAGSAWVFDVRGTDPEARALIADLLATVPRLHAHSATADLVPLAAAGLCDESTWVRVYDTVIPAKLADPQSTGADPGLKKLAAAVLGSAAVAPAADAARAALFKARKWRDKVDLVTPLARSGWAQVDPADPVMLVYAASDVLDTAALATRLPPVDPVILARERVVQRVTARVTHRGLRIDAAHVEALRAVHLPARATAAELVRGFKIENPGSDRQVAAALEGLGLALPRTKPSSRYPAGQPSVAASVLEQLRGTSGQAGALVAAVLDYRHHDTVLGTFLESYRQLCVNGDGRARPTIYTLGTDTGRMSCVRPNLQQLPRVGGVRACITADPGYLIISADFSGVELRVAAALSGDTRLQQMIADGADLHGLIAAQVWGSSWTKADRYAIKRLVFGHIYGGGVAACARGAGVSESIAASAIDVLASFTPGLAQWSRQLREMVRVGAVAMPTYAGRVIHLTREYPHKAPNYAIQGTARELLVDALERWERTPWAGGVVLPVHDEVLAVVPAADAEAATAALVACMTSELHGVAIVAEASKPAFAWQDAV